MSRNSHTITVDVVDWCVAVHRLCGDGSKVLYVEYKFERIVKLGVETFARQLGEDLILDTEELRALLDL